MLENKRILIIGAGPSGLGAAIFLSDLGYDVRILDRKTSVSPYSKALGVNPRTLQILDSYGITERFLANGRKMEHMNVWMADKHIYQINLSGISHRYPFMLIQGQKDSELILEDELSERGIHVEYGRRFDGIDHVGNNLIVDGDNVSDEFMYVIGADGFHSKLRDVLAIPYKGFSYEDEWELYDVELHGMHSINEGHVRLFTQGCYDYDTPT